MYEDALRALEYFLGQIGEEFWRKWMQQDLAAWHKKRSTSHHLAAYGGMGTLNDVLILPEAFPAIPEAGAWWADPLFTWLKALCFYFARHPDQELTLDQLMARIGGHDASLSAFVGGADAPDAMRGLVTQTTRFQGCRCLDCGHANATDRDVDSFLAEVLVPAVVLQACAGHRLMTAVDDLLQARVPGLAERRAEVEKALATAQIARSSHQDFMRPCPACGSERTAVYRWQLSRGKFVPSKDNLAVATGKVRRH